MSTAVDNGNNMKTISFFQCWKCLWNWKWWTWGWQGVGGICKRYVGWVAWLVRSAFWYDLFKNLLASAWWRNVQKWMEVKSGDCSVVKWRLLVKCVYYQWFIVM